MTDYQIILLPRDNYYAWVAAAKDYALRFGCNLTPDPDSAARYMTPQQTITIAGCADGYPTQGDIQAWFRKNYPSLRLDFIPAQTPDEFRKALQVRLAANDRFYKGGTAFKLLWPTEFPKVTQPFGANPEVYRRWDLPGHEGIDFRAVRGSRIFACADGTVARVDVYAGDAKAQPYGNSVRLQHRDGYLTVYAHLERVAVKVGDAVKAGQVLGTADATGNAAGDHLHLMLKKDGATAAGLTNFPRDIMDPTPFLIWPAEATTSNEVMDTVPAAPATQFPWPPGVCLLGVHGRADGALQEADFAPIREARVEAVKLLTWARNEDIDRIRQINPKTFIFARIFTHIGAPDQQAPFFISETQEGVDRFYRMGVRHFEIHNEPNLMDEGWMKSWKDGREFNAFWMQVRNTYKQKYPDALFGYPGLSPDGFPMPSRYNDIRFLDESQEACNTADFICLHSYWLDENMMNSPQAGRYYTEYRRLFPSKLLFLTEFSNPMAIDRRAKGQQYLRFFQSVRNVPGLGAAFSYLLSASGGFGNEVWRLEDGTMTDIPRVLGQRTAP
jgi:murein DD-endopeptidase MepM/ murein hydrolase activator NlpD